MQETVGTGRDDFAAWLRTALEERLGHEPLGSLRDTRLDCLDITRRHPLMTLAALEGEEARVRPFVPDGEQRDLATLSAVAASCRWDAIPEGFEDTFDKWRDHEAWLAGTRIAACRLRKSALAAGVSADWLAGAADVSAADVSAWLSGDDLALGVGGLRAVGRALRRAAPDTAMVAVGSPHEIAQDAALVDAESVTGALDDRGRKALSSMLSDVGELSSMTPGTCAADDALEVLAQLASRIVMQAREAEAAGFDLARAFEDASHEASGQFGVGHAVMDYVCLDMVWGVDRMASEGAECLRRRVGSARPEELSHYVDMSRDTPLSRRCGRTQSEDGSASDGGAV